MIDSDTYAEAPVLRARVEIPPEALDDALDTLWGLEPAVGAWLDMETNRAFLQAFSIDRAALDSSAEAMEKVAASFSDGNPKRLIEAMPREEWAEGWKKFFHVVNVSPRVTIRPPWEEARPGRPDGVVVCIEPGMSFGTGLHGTTQTCLKFIEELFDRNPSASLLDLGCGSGILSIAARKLGFEKVKGVDYDQAAVRISAQNALENGISDIPFSLCDVTIDPIPQADIVVANILAPVLIAASGRVSRAVSRRKDSALVLSGILSSQFPAVVSAYAAHGFIEKETLVAGEWTSGLFVRKS